MNLKKHNEIIAIRFGGIIRFGQDAIDHLKSSGSYDQLHSRAEFELMTRLDLGDKWGKYAEHAPALFILDNSDTELRYPNPTFICIRDFEYEPI